MKKFIILLANSQRYFIHALRVAMFIFVSFMGGVSIFNQTSGLSIVWGVFMIVVSLLTLLGIWFHKIGLLGGLLVAITAMVGLIRNFIQVKEYIDIFYGVSTSAQVLIFITVGLICASDSAKQIFRSYILRMSR